MTESIWRAAERPLLADLGRLAQHSRLPGWKTCDHVRQEPTRGSRLMIQQIHHLCSICWCALRSLGPDCFNFPSSINGPLPHPATQDAAAARLQTVYQRDAPNFAVFVVDADTKTLDGDNSLRRYRRALQVRLRLTSRFLPKPGSGLPFRHDLIVMANFVVPDEA